MDSERKRLMEERQVALKARDFAQFNKLNLAIARLPMPGVPELTEKDIAAYRAIGRANNFATTHRVADIIEAKKRF